MNYIKSLDGLRSIAIIFVLFYHYFVCQIGNLQILGINLKIIKSITGFTWSGVDLFFVLSGFLIGRILIYNREHKNYFKVFYIKRFLRIFPPYYFIIFSYFFLSVLLELDKFSWLSNQIYPMYSYLLYIQNFWMAKDGFGANWFSVTWSLAVEEQFYLILPFLIFFINLKYLPFFTVLGIILAPIFRYLVSGTGSYVLLISRMDSLLVGVLIAFFYINGFIERKFSINKSFLFLILFSCFISLIFLKINGLANIGGVYVHSLLALFYGTTLVLVLTSSNNNIFMKFLSSTTMLFFSKISYTLYLTHQIFSGLLHQYILKQSPQINNKIDFLVTLLALILTILFSTFSYNYFEKPILSLGTKFKYIKS